MYRALEFVRMMLNQCVLMTLLSEPLAHARWYMLVLS